jgi:colanic acid biosynthesis glycosyl transferase WcaI
LRLLVVSQYFWPETFRVNEIVSELCARGHQVTVLTGRPNYPQGEVFPEYLARPEDFNQYAGAEVIRVPLRPRGQGGLRLLLNYLSFVFWASLAGPWKLRGRKFDAIFVWETSPITSALPAILLKKLKRAPLLMWVLDLWPDTLSAVGLVRSKRLLDALGLLVQFIYSHCDLILAQSKGFFPAIERWSGAPHKSRYFPQWAEAAFDVGLDAATAPELLEHQHHFNIMFAGNIGEAQDFPAILDAAHRLRDRSDIRWLIVGDGRAAPAVRETITRLALQDSVFMFGRHPLHRMPEFFHGADALLVSLKAEPIFSMTIPGKVQSYLAAGRPLLGMLDGEGARVIEEAGAGLVCAAGDGAALAERALRLAGMSAGERDAMGLRGQAYGKEQFDRASLMSQLERWLQESGRGATN